MPAFFPAPEPITAGWLTAVLREAGWLPTGVVIAVTIIVTDAFNSRTRQIELQYDGEAPAGLATSMFLKQNIDTAWAIEAGALEVAFYQLMAELQPPPPGLVPCYAAAHDPASGDSYVLLRDLSATHAPPVTRDQLVSIVDAVPSDRALEGVIDALAQHHAFWWDHPLLASGRFVAGYWSRDADRFAQYLERRSISWQSLIAGEASWFPAELRALYERVFAHLHTHWARDLEPRFRLHHNLTLVHGDAYFSNFLSPKDADSGGVTYLLDWQDPVVDIGGYDLVNLCATFWTPAQRHEAQREQQILRRYHATLLDHGVRNYSWDDLLLDYRAGLIFLLLMPVQDRHGGAPKEYWWPKMQCLVAAFEEWRCAELLKF